MEMKISGASAECCTLATFVQLLNIILLLGHLGAHK